jgi:hypothetical protein
MSLYRVAHVPVKVSLFTLAAGTMVLLTGQVAPAYAATSLRGQTLTCRDFVDLDFALDHPNSRYFEGWTTEDFDTAQTWAASCAASPPTQADQERQSLLAQRRQALQVSGETQHNDQRGKEQHEHDLREQREQEQREAVENAAAEQQRAEYAARRARYDECVHSRPYQRYQAELRVIEALNRQTEAQSILDREKRVEQVSGTTDLYAKHSSGEALVDAQQDLQRWWTAYRQSGGDAPNPQSLLRGSQNPCESLP